MGDVSTHTPESDLPSNFFLRVSASASVSLDHTRQFLSCMGGNSLGISEYMYVL